MTIKACRCGRQYDEAGWRSLPLLGVMEADDGETVELRNCACLSTLGVVLGGVEAVADVPV